MKDMKNDRMNVLWICTDQQRVDTLGCYKNNIVDTPNLDKLAANGALFENAYCQSPVCTPSRASFMTGRYPRTTRCRQNGQEIPSDEKLISKIFKEQGYMCGLSGKLHLAPVHPSVCRGMEKRPDDGYDVFHWSPGGHDGWVLHEYFQWLRANGQEHYSKHPRQDVPGSGDCAQYGMEEEYHQTTWCCNNAINFIEAATEYKDPWFFSINLYDPHHPFDPPKEYLDKYMKRLDEIELPNYTAGELNNKPRYQKMDHKAAYNNIDSNNATYEFDKLTNLQHKITRAAYYAMVDLIDKQIGRIISRLEELGELDNTLVIFMSDHGEMLGDHGIYLKGPYFYEEMVHIPLIMSCPNLINKGIRVKSLVELMDITPTLVEAIGLPKQPQMQGESFLDILTKDETLPHKDCVYSEYLNAMPWHKEPAAFCTMAFDGRYKIVAVHGLNEGELYDLQEDPQESKNLWHDSSHSEVKIDMLVKLCDKLAETTDPLPERLAIW